MARHHHPSNSGEDLPKVPLTRHNLAEAGRLLGYLRPYRVKFVLALLALFVGSLAGLAFPALAGNLVNAALASRQGEPVAHWDQNINAIAGVLIAVLAVQAVLAFFRALWFIEVGERSLADLRRDTYARLVRLSMTYHSSRRVGELASRLSSDLVMIRDALIESIPHFLRQTVLLVGGTTLIARTSLRLTGVMLASLPVLMIAAVLFGRMIRKLARDAQDRLAESNVVVEETLQNIASVKAFANEPFEEGRYRAALDRYLVAALRGAWFQGGFTAFIVFALFGAMVLVLWYGAYLLQTGAMKPGELTSFLLYTVFVAGAFGSFAELYSQIQRTVGASQRVREILHEETEPAGEGHSTARLRGDVSFDAVAFHYPSRPEVPVLRDVTLSARAGERIALVGPSGAGKSTIVSLLLRFYAPQGGQILIDGRPSSDYDLHALRRQMAVVPQDVILFGGTIAENIAYGRPGASPDEIEQAARLANAHDFITSFPEGYQTIVGERGTKLSGGQRQRVAIARALLRNPAILILDEATSSLDSQSEREVMQALDRLMEGRTSLIIAHRLSTVRRADRIHVIKDGVVIESGSHDELVTRPDGLYRTLSQLQFDPDAEAEDRAWPVTTESEPFPPRP